MIPGNALKAMDSKIKDIQPPRTIMGESFIPFASSPKKVNRPACDPGIAPCLSFLSPILIPSISCLI